MPTTVGRTVAILVHIHLLLVSRAQYAHISVCLITAILVLYSCSTCALHRTVVYLSCVFLWKVKYAKKTNKKNTFA